MSDSSKSHNLAESHLLTLLENDPDDWATRKTLAQLLYDDGKTKDAAELVWQAPGIPSIDLELGFAIKVLGKGAPRRAIRLLTKLQEQNKGKAVQNLGLANALMHYGMVMQAARFYGAALAEDESLASADLEHFLLWVDDKEKLWGDFSEDKAKLAELPWMKRDAKEAEALKKAMEGHTTPIKIPDLQQVTAEQVVHEMYVQSSRAKSDPTPPPAVTIPMDRVDSKHVMVDPQRGAGEPLTQQQVAAAAATTGGTTGLTLPNTVQPPAVDGEPVVPQGATSQPIRRPEPAPTQMMIGNSPNPIKINKQSDSAGRVEPTKTQMLSDGRIKINQSEGSDAKEPRKNKDS